MTPRIEQLQEKKLVGKRMIMSLTNNKTGELWRSFMVKRSEISHTVSSDLYSVQVLPPLYFDSFNPNTEFEKWATIEVSNVDTVPAEMEAFTLPGGLYAVFTYKGSSAQGSQVFQYIMGTWLPASGYIIDNRPQFEVLGEKYINDSPDSEEEIWIPIVKKH